MTKRVDQLRQPKSPAKSVKATRSRGFGWVVDIDVHASDATEPLFVRIARALSADIRRGRLRRGSALPGSRALAATLGVHRNTVLAAYRELLAEGFIEPRHGRGTYVSAELPDVRPRSFGRSQRAEQRTPAQRNPERIGFALTTTAAELPSRSFSKRTLRMWGGTPDLRELPNLALARAERRAMRRQPELLGYGDPSGYQPLRAALSGMLAQARGLAIEADDILITRGSQMGVALASASLLRPGDHVAVEAWGYPPAWHALRHTGARLVPIQVDAEGMRVDELARLCERRTIRAVYVTPHHQYPTTVPLSPGRRLALLELAERQRMAIIEDDYDHEFHYEGRPLLPLKSADGAGCVIYIGTLSKVLAPGLRLGYVVAPKVLLREMTARRYYLDRQGDQVMEAALAELIEDGELARHIRRMRRLYLARRDRCVALLREHLSAELEFQVPSGGMALWARAAEGIDVERWARAGEEEGVSFQPGHSFQWEKQRCQHVRLGFAPLQEGELATAVRALVRSVRRVTASPGKGGAGRPVNGRFQR